MRGGGVRRSVKGCGGAGCGRLDGVMLGASGAGGPVSVELRAAEVVDAGVVSGCSVGGAAD